MFALQQLIDQLNFFIGNLLYIETRVEGVVGLAINYGGRGSNPNWVLKLAAQSPKQLP